MKNAKVEVVSTNNQPAGEHGSPTAVPVLVIQGAMKESHSTDLCLDFVKFSYMSVEHPF